MQKQRSNWSKFRRALAHESDCQSRGPILAGESVGMLCDLDFGHKGLHQHETTDGYWVWTSDRFVTGFVSK